MSMRPWLAGVRLEWLLLSRDWHALALLFFMPLAFVLTMSLALQDVFAQRAGRKLSVVVIDHDGGEAARALIDALTASDVARIAAADPMTRSVETGIAEQLRRGQHAFAVIVAAGYSAALPQAAAKLDEHVTLLVAPDASQQTEAIFVGALREILARQRLAALLAPFKEVFGDVDLDAVRPKVAYVARGGQTAQAPSAVQQSVPAWLAFGMFFVVIPLANSLIRERQQGVLRRLRTMPVSRGTLLAGKFVPYFAINQLQAVLMLVAGCYLTPALGGEALHLQGSMWGLALACVSLSVAALGYALFIAALARTSEQASLLGGAGNLILAAVGGIMVPKFVMPEFMQRLTDISPMAWGLQAFLDILLRAGGVRDILGEAAALCGFGLVMLALSVLLQARRALP